jgi:2-keto-4-pentenoate hydratase/2-oxohepta-3-ene-1,7-dioic acid hydratase in catechol pathway
MGMGGAFAATTDIDVTGAISTVTGNKTVSSGAPNTGNITATIAGSSVAVSQTGAQTGNTTTMIFGVKHLVSYVSRFMKLEPGDVITTGTPPGVALGRKPPNYLRAGDTMSCGIEVLGSQASRVVAWKKEV